MTRHPLVALGQHLFDSFQGTLQGMVLTGKSILQPIREKAAGVDSFFVGLMRKKIEQTLLYDGFY